MASAASASDHSILRLDYGNIRAYRAYTTEFQRIDNAPQRIGKLKIVTIGQYCNFVTQRLVYLRSNGDYERAPRIDGDSFVIDDNVYAIKYDFTQESWDNVDCTIEFRTSTAGDSSTDEWYENLTIESRFTSIFASLLDTTMTNKHGYEDVDDSINYFRSRFEVFYDSVRYHQTSSRLRTQLQRVQIAFNTLEADFYAAHADSHNEDVEQARESLVESYYKVTSLMNQR